MNRSVPQHLVEVVFGLRETPTPESMRALKETVGTYLTDLVDDLGLPGTLRLEVSAADASDWPDAVPFRISINGKPCRPNREGRPFSPEDPQELVGAIVEGVYFNRDLLLSEEVLSALIKNAEESCPGISHDRACTSVREAVRRGFAPTKVVSAVERFEDAQPPEVWLEDALSAAFIPEVRVHVGKEQYALLRAPKPDDSFGETLEDTVGLMRRGLFDELGLLVGNVELTLDATLCGPMFRPELNGLRRAPVQGLRQVQFLVNDTAERLKLLGVRGIPAVNPANRSEMAVIESEEARKVCESAGLTCWDPRRHMILALSSLIRANAGGLLTVTQVEYGLSVLATKLPRLVGAARDLIPTVQLCRVLRGLLEEGVSIRNLKRILESLLDLYFDCGSPDVEACIEHVRTALSRQIRHKLGSESQIVCVLIDSDFEERLRVASDVPLTAAEEERFREGVAREMGSPPTGNEVLLTDRSIRGAVRKLIAIEFPRVAVLSYHELHPDLNIQPVGCVTLADRRSVFG